MNGPAAHTRERQDQHLVSFNSKQKFPDKKAKRVAGSLLSRRGRIGNKPQDVGHAAKTGVTQSQRDNISMQLPS